MIRLVFPLAVLAVVMAGSAFAEGTAGREFKDITKFAREHPHAVSPQADQASGSIAANKNRPARDGVTGDVQTKKHGSLDVSKLGHDGSRTPAAIGKAIGGHANDGDED